MSGNKYSWFDAFQITQDYGFYLVTINSQEEQDFIQGVLTGSDGEFWIGLTQNIGNENYSEPDGGWEWVTGECLDYENWRMGCFY